MGTDTSIRGRENPSRYYWAGMCLLKFVLAYHLCNILATTYKYFWIGPSSLIYLENDSCIKINVSQNSQLGFFTFEVLDRVESDPGGAVGGSSNLCPNLSSFLPLPPIFCGFGFLSLHILESAISEQQHQRFSPKQSPKTTRTKFTTLM